MPAWGTEHPSDARVSGDSREVLQVEKKGADGKRDNNLFRPVQRSFPYKSASVVDVE
jgi:hypothetical protein